MNRKPPCVDDEMSDKATGHSMYCASHYYYVRENSECRWDSTGKPFLGKQDDDNTQHWSEQDKFLILNKVRPVPAMTQ